MFCLMIREVIPTPCSGSGNLQQKGSSKTVVVVTDCYCYVCYVFGLSKHSTDTAVNSQGFDEMHVKYKHATVSQRHRKMEMGSMALC